MTKLTVVGLFLIAVVLGAALDLAVGPVLGSGSETGHQGPGDSERHSDQKASVSSGAASPRLESLRVEPRRSSPPARLGPQDSDAAPAQNHEQGHPESLTPTPVLDIYQELSLEAYHNLLGRVRLYSLLDDHSTALAPNEGTELWSSVGVESVARAAVSRRGDVRLPADRYVLLGFPIDDGHHEVHIGIPQLIDHGSPEQILKFLAREAGLRVSSLDPTTPAYAEALAVAEAFMRDQIRHRLKERSALASLIRTTAAGTNMLRGQAFVVLTGETTVRIVPISSDDDLRLMLDQYAMAPSETRAAVKQLVNR